MNYFSWPVELSKKAYRVSSHTDLFLQIILTLENSSSILIADIANENIKIRCAFCDVPANMPSLSNLTDSFDLALLSAAWKIKIISLPFFGHCYDKNVNCKT